MAFILLIELLSPALHKPERWCEPDRELYTAIQNRLHARAFWLLVPLAIVAWIGVLWIAGERGVPAILVGAANLLAIAAVLFVFLLRTLRGPVDTPSTQGKTAPPAA